jgi:hypothetical protein
MWINYLIHRVTVAITRLLSVFAALRASQVVGTGGRVLVSFGRLLAGAASVAAIDFETMCPAVAGVGYERAVTGGLVVGVGILPSCLQCSKFNLEVADAGEG